ncbi:7288_t:CDS:2, partial [Acaulospora colombiana]
SAIVSHPEIPTFTNAHTVESVPAPTSPQDRGVDYTVFMSSTFISTASSSVSGSTPTPFPSPDPRQNADPFENGPSVYLYGFLATLVLIFLVSVAVAWRGYYTRRILRARIDEAIARGLYVPGYSDDGTPLSFAADSRRRGGPLPPKPIIWDAFLAPAEKRPDNIEWDVKPAAVTAIKPASDPEPASTIRNSPSHARTLMHQIVDPIRNYWFVNPPQGTHANQLQGRPDPTSDTARNDPQLFPQIATEEKQDELKDVEEVIVSVLIAMPSPAASAQRKLDLSNQASSSSSSSRPTSASIPTSSSRPTSFAPNGHQPNEPEELPELAIGLAELPLTRPTVVELVVGQDDVQNDETRMVNNGKEPLR